MTATPPDSESWVLAIIDWQERLAAAMPRAAREAAVAATLRLIRAAAILKMPVLVSEQYPQGLGHTIATIRAELATPAFISEKLSFSALACEEFRRRLDATGRRNVLLAGLETHVCVLQTAGDLQREGFGVGVAADAVCSRAPLNSELALQHMRSEGTSVLGGEAWIFKFLGSAGNPRFKEISALLK